jgi:predicted ATPase
MASSPSSSTPPETATLSEGSVDVEQHHEAAALTVADVNYANAQRGDHATNNNNNNTASISTDGEGANSRNNNNPQPPPPLYRFVMTGGPCGGKTTALARVFSFLRERGFEVISCPEAFTLLRSNGLSVDYFSTPGIDYYIQGAVLDAQTTLENGVARVLQARGNPAVILCDRGTMDGKVYMDEHKFAQIMAERHTNMVQLRDERYDAIFHLVTCADGAVQHYTLENNKARTETAQEAIAVDVSDMLTSCHVHCY